MKSWNQNSYKSLARILPENDWVGFTCSRLRATQFWELRWKWFCMFCQFFEKDSFLFRNYAKMLNLLFNQPGTETNFLSIYMHQSVEYAELCTLDGMMRYPPIRNVKRFDCS